MSHILAQNEWEHVLDDVLWASARHVQAIGRSEFHKRNNERFYHHQFSCFLSRHLMARKLDIWEEHLLWPEAKTVSSFKWKSLKVGDLALSRGALSGQKANYDFEIATDPIVRVEWKGPWMYSIGDIAKVCLKLLHGVSNCDVKLICAILVSSKTGDQRHIDTVQNNFLEGLHFAFQLLGLESIEHSNLFAYVATVTDTQVLKCHWGRINSTDQTWEPREAEQ